MSTYGALPPDASAAARRRERIGGGLLFAGICVNLTATLLPAAQANRALALVLFGIGGSLVIAAAVFMIAARRAV